MKLIIVLLIAGSAFAQSAMPWSADVCKTSETPGKTRITVHASDGELLCWDLADTFDAALTVHAAIRQAPLSPAERTMPIEQKPVRKLYKSKADAVMSDIATKALTEWLRSAREDAADKAAGDAANAVAVTQTPDIQRLNDLLKQRITPQPAKP